MGKTSSLIFHIIPFNYCRHALTKLQEITLGKINAAKGVAHKVTSVAEVQEIIKTMEVG